MRFGRAPSGCSFRVLIRSVRRDLRLQDGTAKFSQTTIREMTSDGEVSQPGSQGPVFSGRMGRLGPAIARAGRQAVANIRKRISFHAASNHAYRGSHHQSQPSDVSIH
jgi:hypothetical protein